MRKHLITIILSTLVVSSCTNSNGKLALPGFEKKISLDKIKLPPGFSISVFAKDVKNVRSMALSPSGVLYAGSRQEGKVYALRDTDGDYKVDEKKVIAAGLNMPNGVAFKDGDLYVAEVSRILRFPEIEQNLDKPATPEVIFDEYPEDTHHGWKFIAFGPDDRLYVPVGAPCNVCLEDNPVYATITSMKPDGTDLHIFASGIRNSVGFDWHPQTKELWFTDNGRDYLGDERPPDELNHASQKGLHFGFPFCHGSNIADPEFGEQKPCSEFTSPAASLAPHAAALGMRFYTGQMFPESYTSKIFIAEHGSWNRSQKIGYRISTVTLKNGTAGNYEVFAEGWLEGNNAWGRPVDVLVMPDGSLLVSDDYANAIYRITSQP